MMLDTIAGIAMGLFLLTVASRGKTGNMVDLAKRDRAFLQWAVAVGILVYLHGVPELAGPVRWLIVLSFIGLALTKSDEIKKNAGSFWQSLGG
jgi:hypothetical protein